MTQEQLSLQKYRFSRVINTSEENFSSKQQPSEVDLAACFYAFFQREYVLPPPEEPTPIKTPEEHRSQALDSALLKLSSSETAGKEHIEAYLRHQYRRNFQANTIRGSYTSISYFFKFLKERGIGGIDEIKKADLEAFVEHEQDRGIKISTVKLRLAQVKAFLRFMIDKGDMSEEVFPWKLTIKMPEPLPRAMDPVDVDRLFVVKASVRDRAMIMLLLRTGMRIGEVLRTRMRDVNMEEQKILIYEGEKNQRGRVVYFSEDAKEALQAWVAKRNRSMELLFYGYKGKVLSYPAARMMFIKYLQQAGLSHKGYTLHCLRHTYATDLINARMPLECLEKLMGHSRLGVTRRYAMLTDKTREEEYFKAMAIIERREKDEHYGCDRELQTLLKKTQLLPSHGEELHEHP
jgi:integrase/recombinase XerD